MSIENDFMPLDLSPRPEPPPSFLIWWLTQADCEAIGERLEGVPEYIASEYRSRLGRGGNGRLWVSPTLEGAPRSLDVPNTPLARWTENAGGIVILERHAIFLTELPGLITTTQYRRRIFRT